MTELFEKTSAAEQLEDEATCLFGTAAAGARQLGLKLAADSAEGTPSVEVAAVAFESLG